MEYKIELLRLGKSQVNLMDAINSREEFGLKCTMTDVSYSLKGTPRPKYDRIREASEVIINEWKAAATP